MTTPTLTALLHKHHDDQELAPLLAQGQGFSQQGKNRQAASCLEQAGLLLLRRDEEQEGLMLWQSAIAAGGGEAVRPWLALLERHERSLPQEKVKKLWRWVAKIQIDSCNDGYLLEYSGDKLYKLKCYEQAIPLYKKAYSLGRQSLELCNMIALSLAYILRDHEAIVWFRKGEGAPYDKVIAYWKARTIQFSGQGSQREVNQLWDRWGRERLADAPARPEMPPHRRPLRLGFCSHYLGGGGGFSDHFVTHLVPALARRGVEVLLYILKVENPESLPELPGSQWVHLGKLDWPEKARRIREDQLHALIEFEWLPINRLFELYQYSPAPLVMSFLHPISSQCGAVDCLIMDDYYCPTGVEADFSEKIVRTREPIQLPPPMATSKAQAPLVVPPPCLTQGFITFGSFNRSYRLNEATLAVWCEVMKQVPKSRLLLHSNSFDDYETDRVSKLLQHYGLKKERFRILGFLNLDEYFALHDRIDIALDPLFCNGGMTSLDALWQGVPVLTCPGSPEQLVTSRAGAALLTAIGRTEWIARDLEHWKAMIVDAASDYHRLNRWRFELRPQIAGSILCDAERRADVFLEAITPVIDEHYQ